MKRFLIAALLTVPLGLGTSSKADAQIVYGYSVPTDDGLEDTSSGMFAPGGYYPGINGSRLTNGGTIIPLDTAIMNRASMLAAMTSSLGTVIPFDMGMTNRLDRELTNRLMDRQMRLDREISDRGIMLDREITNRGIRVDREITDRGIRLDREITDRGIRVYRGITNAIRMSDFDMMNRTMMNGTMMNGNMMNRGFTNMRGGMNMMRRR
jgi:hypothetical protein